MKRSRSWTRVIIMLIAALIFIGACNASYYQCPDGSKVTKLEQCKGKTPIERTTATTTLIKTEAPSSEEPTTTIIRERQWRPKDDDKAKKRKSKATNQTKEEEKQKGNNNTTLISWEKFAEACTKQAAHNSDTLHALDPCLFQYAVNAEEVIYCSRISNTTIKEACYQKMKAHVINLFDNETRGNNNTDNKLAEKIGNQACIDLGCPPGTLYTGSKNSDIYHECHCGFAKRITTENRVCFNTIPPGRRPSARC